MIKYFKLLDKKNYELLIKADGRKQFKYIFGADEWIRSSMLLSYQSVDSTLYEMYEEIGENDAEILLEKQRVYYSVMKKKALEIAVKAHENQYDKGGKPYIEHPIMVASNFNDYEYEIVALLHDVLEDSDITDSDLRDAGFNERIIASVKILTKDKETDYFDYLRKVKNDGIARAVKIADIHHNIDLNRISNPSEKDYKRVEKYKIALDYLEN